MPLKRWEAVCAFLGVVLLGLGLAARYLDAQPRQNLEIHAEGFTVPVTILDVKGRPPIGAAVAFHGLSANRGIMVTLGRSLARDGIVTYLVDLSGHGDNTDAFSFENVERSAAAVVSELAAEGAIVPERTVLIGHSMGGDIVIRLADKFPAAATVAISPGPLVPTPPVPDRLRPYSMPARLPRNLLILVGSVDLPMFEWAAYKLVESAGGAREADENFRAGNALAVRTIPWSTHTGLAFRAEVFQQISQWAQISWGDAILTSHEDTGPLLRMVVIPGVILIFPALTSLFAFVVGAKIAARIKTGVAAMEPSLTLSVLVRWAALALLVVLLLKFIAPLFFLRLASGDYLASVLLLVGLAGISRIFRNEFASASLSGTSLRSITGGAGAAAFVILGLGLAVTGEFGDLWMNAARWWRFVALVPLLLSYFLLEESLLGSPALQLSSAIGVERRRWLLYFMLRGILWLSMMVGLFFMGGKEVLVMVMGLVFIGFSAGQRFGSDMVRRRFGSVEAAAIFSAILGAWFLAAVFPLT